jgi:hypothetical protein
MKRRKYNWGKEMQIGRTLKTILVSFAGGALSGPARPVRRFSIWDVQPAVRAILRMGTSDGLCGEVAVKELIDKNMNPNEVVGVTIFFPFIQPITGRAGDEGNPLGYLCNMGGPVVCYDAVGGKPILHETKESSRRREREVIASGFVFEALDLPNLTIEGQSGRVIGNRFYPLDALPSEEGCFSICFTAKMGNRVARIGYSTTHTFNFDLINAGQDNFIQPVFDPQSFLRGGNFDPAQASLVGLVERRKGDTSN